MTNAAPTTTSRAKVFADVDAALDEKQLSVRSRRQYLNVIERFEGWGRSRYGWDAKPETFEMASQALESWFGQLSSPSAATVASYCAILGTYMKAVGYPIDVAALIGPRGDDEHARKIIALTNLEVRRLRLALKNDPITRSALELAIAGTRADEIPRVVADDIGGGSTIAKVAPLWLPREIEVFDRQSAAWLTGEGRRSLPRSKAQSEVHVRRQLAHLIRQVTGREGGLRDLRLTGVRKAMAGGYRPPRIAESLGLRRPVESWNEFPVRASKAAPVESAPAPADPNRGRKLVDLPQEDFDLFVDNLPGVAQDHDQTASPPVK